MTDTLTDMDEFRRQARSGSRPTSTRRSETGRPATPRPPILHRRRALQRKLFDAG